MRKSEITPEDIAKFGRRMNFSIQYFGDGHGNVLCLAPDENGVYEITRVIIDDEDLVDDES